MFGKNIKTSLIMWAIVLIILNVTIFLFLYYAYVGPPEEFWDVVWGAWKVMTGTIVTLAVVSELVTRLTNRKKE